MDSHESIWANVESIPPVQADILSESRVGQYDLLRLLGEGEFAKVQSARKRGEPGAQTVAVKHISKSRLICASNIKRTLRRIRRVGTEIEAMRAVDSPWVCRLFDVYHSPQYVHVVMENGGRDLYELIGDDCGLDVAAAQAITLGLARALAAIFAVGIVHRDVKPENVLARTRRPSEGSGEPALVVVESVKLCDFGLCAIAPIVQSPTSRFRARCGAVSPAGAEAASDGRRNEGSHFPSAVPDAAAALDESTTRRATPETVLGTDDALAASAPAAAAAPHAVARDWTMSDFSGSPGFVAPEIVTSEKYDGSRVDAFSLGCVLLELVLGHAAFDEIWMVPYSHDVMADTDLFNTKLRLALAHLRRLPEFRDLATKRAARTDAAAAAAAGDVGAAEAADDEGVTFEDEAAGAATPSFRVAIAPGRDANTLRSLVFGLLKLEPDARLSVQAAAAHPWLAAAAAEADAAGHERPPVEQRAIAAADPAKQSATAAGLDLADSLQTVA